MVVAYTMSLLLTVVRHSTDMGVMERFGPRLVALSEEGKAEILLLAVLSKIIEIYLNAIHCEFTH